MNQIPNIEETHDTETEEVNAKIYEYVHHFEEREVSELPLGGLYKIVEVALTAQKQTHHHQLQKAREEERERVVKIVEKEAAETYVEMLGAVIDQHGLKVQDYTVINTAMIQHILTGTIGNLSTRIYKAIHSELDQDTKETLQEAISDPEIVKQAAVLGAEDQNKMLDQEGINS